jgi:hypothetical protein
LGWIWRMTLGIFEFEEDRARFTCYVHSRNCKAKRSNKSWSLL